MCARGAPVLGISNLSHCRFFQIPPAANSFSLAKGEANVKILLIMLLWCSYRPQIPEGHLIGKDIVFIENQEANFLAISKTIRSIAFILFRNFQAWVPATAVNVASHICLSYFKLPVARRSVNTTQISVSCLRFFLIEVVKISNQKLQILSSRSLSSAINNRNSNQRIMPSFLLYHSLPRLLRSASRFINSFFKIASLGDQLPQLKSTRHVSISSLSRLLRLAIKVYKLFLQDRFAQRSVNPTQISVSCHRFFFIEAFKVSSQRLQTFFWKSLRSTINNCKSN